MKATVRVGDVSVTVDGMDLSRRQLRALLMDCAGIAASLTPEEPEERTPLGFSAHTERAPEPKPESIFTDDEE